MPSRLQQTERILASTRNRAVLPLLAAAMSSSSAEMRAAAIRATIRRTDVNSHTKLIRQFSKFADAERTALFQAHRAMPHHAAPALKAAVLAGDAVLCENACNIILLCHDYELFDVLVKAVVKPRHRQAGLIAATILQLASLLHDEIIQWAAGDRTGRDPSFDRHQGLAVLERFLLRPADRHPSEMVDAFLLLAPCDNSTLLKILRDSSHPCHAKMVATLLSSQSPSIMERLVAMLRDTDTPVAALEAIGRRADRPFVDFLLHELKHPVPLRVLHNMKRLTSISWLEDHRETLLELDGRAQAIAVDLAMASNLTREAQFDLLALMMRSGLAEGRRASYQALAKFDSPAAHELVLAALRDPDSAVQAAAVRQLRPRRLPNALQLLVARLEAPALEVREAARSSLAEFNFVRYWAMFDLLDEHVARTTGVLVRQIDPTASEKLVSELSSPSITARLRGIEVAVAMEATRDVREQLLELVRHENPAVRKEAVTALAHTSGPRVLEALELATRDSNHSVAEAARQSLAQHRRDSGEFATEPAVLGRDT
jgi:hypothetical protein